MPDRASLQLPTEALRDLLAIARTLFAELTATKGNPIALQELVEVQRLLREALDISVRSDPGTLDHRVGWQRAQEGIQRLSLIVTHDMQLGTLLARASERVTEGGLPAPRDWLSAADREARRRHRNQRN